MLDAIIERFSPDEAWREWEDAFADGRLSARNCLQKQVENLRVTRRALLDYLSQVRIDPVFVEIVRWSGRRGVEAKIVSDSFAPLISHMLRNNGIDGVPVLANDLAFSGDRLIPSFPFHDPACPRSANAKAQHLAPYRAHGQEHSLIFAGDGRSDLDAALIADVVFAKGTLAKELDARAIPYRRFETLEPVLAYLESNGAAPGAREPVMRHDDERASR